MVPKNPKGNPSKFQNGRNMKQGQQNVNIMDNLFQALLRLSKPAVVERKGESEKSLVFIQMINDIVESKRFGVEKY